MAGHAVQQAAAAALTAVDFWMNEHCVQELAWGLGFARGYCHITCTLFV
jgi:hypothetical protein